MHRNLKKQPPNTPRVGDRVKLRGKAATGVLNFVNVNLWSTVKWDEGVDLGLGAPRIVHLFELEKIL